MDGCLLLMWNEPPTVSAQILGDFALKNIFLKTAAIVGLKTLSAEINVWFGGLRIVCPTQFMLTGSTNPVATYYAESNMYQG